MADESVIRKGRGRPFKKDAKFSHTTIYLSKETRELLLEMCEREHLNASAIVEGLIRLAGFAGEPGEL